MFRRKNIQKVLEHTKQNREEVLASETCGCLNCCSVFPPSEIKDWTDEDDHGHRKRRADRTAICPHCGEMMVIGDRSGHKVSPATLDMLRSRMRP